MDKVGFAREVTSASTSLKSGAPQSATMIEVTVNWPPRNQVIGIVIKEYYRGQNFESWTPSMAQTKPI